MRRTIAILSTIFFLIISPVFTGKAAAHLSASDYAGYWKNKDPNLNFIQFIEITAVDSNTLQIRTWLRCFPKLNQGGTRRDCQFWGTDEVYSSTFEEVIWKHDELQKHEGRQRTVTFKNVLTLYGDTLCVFTEGPGWNNYFVRTSRPGR